MSKQTRVTAAQIDRWADALEQHNARVRIGDEVASWISLTTMMAFGIGAALGAIIATAAWWLS